MVSTGTCNGCPVCRTALATTRIEPIVARQCPRCEAELWEVGQAGGSVFWVRRPEQSAAEFIAALGGPRRGLSPMNIASLLRSADHFDLFELLLRSLDHGLAAMRYDGRPALSCRGPVELPSSVRDPRKAAYHAAMSKKWAEAAEHAWLPVAPDPPGPD
jgi:hypothetical protein